MKLFEMALILCCMSTKVQRTCIYSAKNNCATEGPRSQNLHFMAVSAFSVGRISIDQQCKHLHQNQHWQKTLNRTIPITNKKYLMYPWTFKDCIQLFEHGMWTYLIILWMSVSKALGQISASDGFMTCRVVWCISLKRIAIHNSPCFMIF